MPTDVERLRRENEALQKTYDRLNSTYGDHKGMADQLSQMKDRINANAQLIKKGMLSGTLDELKFTTTKRGV